MTDEIKVPRTNRFRVELWILASCILGTIVLFPKFVRNRSAGAANACIANLKQIDEAKEKWALEAKALTNASPVPPR